MVTLPRRPEIVAVAVRLMGSEATPGETKIVCLGCAQPWQQVLADYTKQALDSLEANYACENCGRIIGTFRPDVPLGMVDYKALAARLGTLNPEDLINLISVTMRNRPDFTPVPQPAEAIEQYDLDFDIEPDNHLNDLPEMPVIHSHFVVTINNKTRLPNLASQELARPVDDYQERLEDVRNRLY